MRSVLIASLLAAAIAASPPNKQMLFENFMVKYDRQYATEFEKGKRFQIFSQNVDDIYASNAKNKSYTLGITAHTDLTFEEWRAGHLNGFKPMLTATKGERPIFKAPADFKDPDSVDWVKKGGVTEVKNQGTCGSCWTFSTVGALEGAMFISGRKMVDLSMQHILACDKGGNGCGGGQMDQAFDWVSENGVPALTDEPYLCKDGDSSECQGMTCSACTKKTGETCIMGSCNKVNGSVCVKTGLLHHCECPSDQCFSETEGTCGSAKPEKMVLAVGDVTKHTDVDPSEGALEAAVAQQPVSVAIEADKSVFQHYTSGILTNDACGSNLDHGVLAVGYGEDNGVKYWKVKNSWGTTFGEDGYIRIEKGKTEDGGECGIRKMASFPTVKSSSTIVV
jgi:C1A family cysteine protease